MIWLLQSKPSYPPFINIEISDKLKWEVGPWGPCMEAENKKDLTFNTGQNGDNKENYGLMQRNVSCILTSHDDVKVS